jgi:hypothetical protein
MRTSRIAVAALIPLLSGALGGCSWSLGRDAAIRADPTPELDTLAQRPVGVDNQLAIMSDENWRMFNQDFMRAFYIDRPSRLTREPIPRQ